MIGPDLVNSSAETDYELSSLFLGLNGNFKWIVFKCQLIQVLVILEQDFKINLLIIKFPYVEITNGKILGYYYDGDESHENLFWIIVIFMLKWKSL